MSLEVEKTALRHLLSHLKEQKVTDAEAIVQGMASMVNAMAKLIDVIEDEAGRSRRAVEELLEALNEKH